MGGCESGFTYPDLTDPNIVWATCYGDEVTRWDARTKLARSVSPWLHTLDSPPNETKYRCHWTAPLAKYVSFVLTGPETLARTVPDVPFKVELVTIEKGLPLWIWVMLPSCQPFRS